MVTAYIYRKSEHLRRKIFQVHAFVVMAENLNIEGIVNALARATSQSTSDLREAEQLLKLWETKRTFYLTLQVSTGHSILQPTFAFISSYSSASMSCNGVVELHIRTFVAKLQHPKWSRNAIFNHQRLIYFLRMFYTAFSNVQ